MDDKIWEYLEGKRREFSVEKWGRVNIFIDEKIKKLKLKVIDEGLNFFKKK